MGCTYPIKVRNPNYKNGGIHIWERQLYYFVPCGQCLECMKNKRTWLSDVCNFEYNKYGIGSFTTLTYDDENIVIEGTRAVLRYKDFQDFNKRLRENLEKKYNERVKYSFICVGEYGTENERPHMHILFFGLDWQKDDKIITESWNKGIVQNKPIKRGGISYVLKYLDKDRIRNNKHYNENKDLRPFLKHSVGIANDFIKAHYKEIMKYHGCYTMDNGQTLKPIPSYYMRKLLIYKPLDLTRIKQKMYYEHWKDKKDIKEYSKTEVMEYIMLKSREDYEKIIRISRANGEPQQDFDEFYYDTRKKEII